MKTPTKKPLIVKCPKCGKRVEWAKNEFRPFCSERCQTSDKAAWASDEYTIPDSSNSPPSDEYTIPDSSNTSPLDEDSN